MEEFRIERQAPDILRVYRGEHLVAEDVMAGGDSLAKVERWGRDVAWAEDHTAIAHWDARPPGEQWQTLVGLAYRYIRWAAEGVTSWDEIAPDGWSNRHVEADADGRHLAAAARSELLRARSRGGAEGVTVYEETYGVLPEAPFRPDVEAMPGVTPVSGAEFLREWTAAREALDPA